MIEGFRHKGLRQLFESDNPKGVNADHVRKIKQILALLNAAQKIAYVTAEREFTRLYLTMVPADNAPANVAPANKDNVFQGGLTPYAP